MSTTALHIIELIKSLPARDQRLILAALNRQLASQLGEKHSPFRRTPDGGYYDPEGIPNDHPFFKIMEEIEEQRHRTSGRPAPDFE